MNLMSTRRRFAAAFTLVELLVVIGIIALLISILLPALSKVQQQTRKVACQSNLRQIGQAMTIYTNDTKYYPGCLTFRGFPYAIWPTRLRKVMRQRPGSGNNVFYCPSQEQGFRWQAKFGSGGDYATATDQGYGYEAGELLLNVHRIPFSYGYNDWGAKSSGQGSDPTANQKGLGGDIVSGTQLKELKASQVRRASEMIAVADNTCDGAWDYNIDPVAPPAEWPGKIHSGGGNYLFCDGHVEWHIQKEMVNVHDAGKDPINRLYNNDNTVVKN
jgi:prepilin-type processing-associated H-X9-DG protein